MEIVNQNNGNTLKIQLSSVGSYDLLVPGEGNPFDPGIAAAFIIPVNIDKTIALFISPVDTLIKSRQPQAM